MRKRGETVSKHVQKFSPRQQYLPVNKVSTLVTMHMFLNNNSHGQTDSFVAFWNSVVRRDLLCDSDREILRCVLMQ